MATVIKIFSKSFFAAVAILCSMQAQSQSMSILGGSSLARDCFEAANAAVMTQNAGYVDVETCSDALIYGQLNQRDVIATYVNRGVIYVALEKYDRAISDYEKALGMDSFEPATYLNRGNLWFMAEKFDRAIDDYTKSLDLGLTKRHVAHLNRGLAYEYRGDLQQAQRDYRESISLQPEWEVAREKLARVEKKLAN